ncbi:purine-binding chemotaxis protein CheW [Tranquillimonas rosea]|uniref:Purine-binding chemotaxis protein CheW n=1 Tax=Tranquillimonas rosea TaxID=641238 RepID=A0A1H9RDJ0_9RHOB|nr:chemotaxis protein CheW [Tranquillimonas rosea]SER70734.1 purine-binding chemotaxis protein CheW [Tranquillimonas rosea]
MNGKTVVTFGLGDALFALPVAPVMEILDTSPIAPLPRAPAHLLGLIDRRGASVPVVDLRRLLGEPPQDDTPETRIIVLRLETGGIGLRVDRVIEVTQLDEAGAAPLPEAGLLNWNERMVAGVGRRDGAFVSELRVEALFDPEITAALSPEIELQ